MSVSHLWPLWLLAALPLLWLAVWRRDPSLNGRRVVWAAALRSLALASAALALMRPALPVASHEISVVYALDISRSVSSAFIDRAMDWIRSANARGRPAQARYVVFADRARLVESIDDIPSVVVSADDTDPVPGSIRQTATNLEVALDTSRHGFLPQHCKRLVLLSDGNQTDGDVWRAAARLRSQRIRVFAIPAAVGVQTDVWMLAAQIPDGTRAREPVSLKVRAFSRSRTQGRVELRVAGALPSVRTVTLEPGENEWTFRTEFQDAGSQAVDVKIRVDGDQVPENDALQQSVWIDPAPKVLYVQSGADGDRFLAEALRQHGIEVSVATADAVGRDLRRIDGHDAVVISDVAAEAMGPALSARLEAFVRDGGGLIFIAGESTYGKAGFAGSALEKLLPVKFEAPRQRQELDLVLLIDRSFSMRGLKLEYAKTAALAALDGLDAHHRFGVVAFDSRPYDVVPLHTVDDRRQADDLISSISASGQTNIYNALWHAYELLHDSEAEARHVILLSDGNTAPIGRRPADPAVTVISAAKPALSASVGRGGTGISEEDMPTSFPEMAALFAKAGVTLSTVGIGDEPDLQFLANLAKWTRGQAHVAAREEDIPALFAKETRRLTGKSLVEEPFRPLSRFTAELVAGVNFATGPQLHGYVIVRPKRHAEVLLEATQRRPLFVQHHYGLGRTAAFLSDAKNRWAADWLDWPGYGKFWAQVVRDTVRRDAGETLRFAVTREARQAVVTLEATSGDADFRNGLQPTMKVSEPNRSMRMADLMQTGPGHYVARIPLSASPAASYRFEIVKAQGVTSAELARLGPRTLYYSHSDEYRVLPTNTKLLRALSAQTGGTFAPAVADVFAACTEGGRTAIPLWPYLCGAALLLYLLDLAVRRFPGVQRV